MHICFIVEGYPTSKDPFMPFIKNTVAEMAKQGIKCSVIAPQSITRALSHKVPLRPQHWIDRIDNNKAQVEVHQPMYLTLSGKAGKVNRELFFKAAQSAYNKIRTLDIDAMYAHFWHMGIVASRIDSGKPLFVACGESKIGVREQYSDIQINRMLNQLRGAIYVSSKSYEEAVSLGLQRENSPYIVLPNGYNSFQFNRVDKRVARSALNWPLEARIVIFVGAFIPRKGTLRVSQALAEINKHRPVYSCFIGSGTEVPTCPNLLHVGKVDHSEIATYLSAADIFVLPTTNEGCCNAIIEAMACGLPIISSNGSFNDDILESSNSIRIDPMDVIAISQAIEVLLENPEMSARMGEKSSELAKSLTIEKRIIKLRTFMEQII